MAATASTAAPRTGTRLDDLKIRKLKPLEVAQNVIYSVAGLHLGVIVMYGVYVIVFLGTYRFFGYDFTLRNWWLNLPDALHLPSLLAWVPVGSAGGLGNFIAGNWDLIQHAYFLKIPMGILGFVFVGLILSKASKKPLGAPGKVDALLCRLGFPNRHQGQVRGAEHGKTSFLQYAFLLPTMLVASAPGVILGSLIVYGGGALLHHFGLSPNPPHPGILDPYVAGSTWQPILIGALGAQLFGRKVVAKPAEDMQLFWLEENLCNYQIGLDTLHARLKGEISDEEAVDNTIKLRNPQPNVLRPPVYVLRYEALEQQILQGVLRIAPHRQGARYAMRALAVIGTFLVLYGGYMYLWFPKHGGWLL